MAALPHPTSGVGRSSSVRQGYIGVYTPSAAWNDQTGLQRRIYPLRCLVSRCGLAVRREAGKQKDLGPIRSGSPLSSKTVVYGYCLVTLPTQLMKR